MCIPSNKASKYTNPKFTELKGEIDNSKIICPMSATDRSRKNSKDTEVLNNIIHMTTLSKVRIHIFIPEKFRNLYYYYLPYLKQVEKKLLQIKSDKFNSHS